MADGPLAVILAAGLGTRMRSARPKVLHHLAGRPLLLHTVDLATRVTGRQPVVVVNPAHPEVRELLEGRAVVVEQPSACGTGDAVRSVGASLREPGPVVVLSGDVPLLRDATLEALIRLHTESGAGCALLSVMMDGINRLGRVVRDAEGHVTGIAEDADVDAERGRMVECNAGVYVFTGAALWPALEHLTTGNRQGEHYLTDVPGGLGRPVVAMLVDDPGEALGINDRCQLAEAEGVLRRRRLEELMRGGVTIEDPATTYVDAEVEVGSDTVLLPMTVLRGATVLGRECTVGPMAQLRDVRAGARVVIGSSHLESCVLGDEVTVGPYNRLRPGAELDAGVTVGTHAEIKNSIVGRGTFINHFSCVLDSDVGSNVNIGAGTVTCNFDGRTKHRTTIGDEAFVGSDSILVAPLQIGAGATVGAGSVITDDVPPGALAIERGQQRTVLEWARRMRRSGQ